MSHTHTGMAAENCRAVEFTALGERFRMVRASQGLLDIGVYHLEALSTGAGALLGEEEAHEEVWAEGLDALDALERGPAIPGP
jgi:hypothetical protein